MSNQTITRPSTLLTLGLSVLETQGRAVGISKEAVTGRVCATGALVEVGRNRRVGAGVTSVAEHYLDKATAQITDGRIANVVALNDGQLSVGGGYVQKKNRWVRAATTRKVKRAYRIAIAAAKRDEAKSRQAKSRAARKLAAA